jgi:hypothetical protein
MSLEYPNLMIDMLVKQNIKIDEFINIHMYASRFYRYTNFILSAINILVLATTAVIGNILQQPTSPSAELATLNNVVLYIASGIGVLIKFLAFEKASETHITKILAYKSLKGSIDNKLLNKATTIDSEYYLWVTKSFDDLLLSEPGINPIINYFYSKHTVTTKSDKKVIGTKDPNTDLIIDVGENKLVPMEAEKYEIQRYLNGGY